MRNEKRLGVSIYFTLFKNALSEKKSREGLTIPNTLLPAIFLPSSAGRNDVISVATELLGLMMSFMCQ